MNQANTSRPPLNSVKNINSQTIFSVVVCLCGDFFATVSEI